MEWEEKLLRFTREIIALPSPSGQEGKVLQRIAEEMERVGWEEIAIDGAGNLRGRIGEGEHHLALDGHADTVGPGELRDWKCDPYQGKMEDGWIWGRGAADQKGGVAAAVYAGALLGQLRPEDDFALFLVVSVQEENCEGLNWDHILQEKGFRPEAVVLTEPSNLEIKRGQRGHLEMLVTARGKSVHAFCPEEGRNAIYAISDLVRDIRELEAKLPAHPELGKGSITVTDIYSRSPSENSVPDYCRIRIDRRFAPDETRESLIEEIGSLTRRGDFQIDVPVYREAGHTGRVLVGEKFFPAWLLEPDHPLIGIARQTARAAWGNEAPVTTWGFSTNGVSIVGKHGIPAFGLGPGKEIMAHRPNERIEIRQIVKASQFYAHFPRVYCRRQRENGVME